MIPQHIQQRLFTLFPDFIGYWNASHNYFRDSDGSFTHCGIFARFSFFFRDTSNRLSAEALGELGCFIAECMAVRHSDVHIAVTTCFLENLIGKPSEQVLLPYLKDDAREFIRQFRERVT
jgi:hypothetical protein